MANKLRPVGPKDCVKPTFARALRDVRFYCDVLTKSKPERYEVYQTAEGGTVRLSDAIRVLLPSTTENPTHG